MVMTYPVTSRSWRYLRGVALWKKLRRLFG